MRVVPLQDGGGTCGAKSQMVGYGTHTILELLHQCQEDSLGIYYSATHLPIPLETGHSLTGIEVLLEEDVEGVDVLLLAVEVREPRDEEVAAC